MALKGLSETFTLAVDDSWMVAVAALVGSATLVAVTVTLWLVLIVEGAVYRPLDREPIGGLSDQITAVFSDPVTVAVNCAVCETDRVTAPGAADTVTTSVGPVGGGVVGGGSVGGGVVVVGGSEEDESSITTPCEPRAMTCPEASRYKTWK